MTKFNLPSRDVVINAPKIFLNNPHTTKIHANTVKSLLIKLWKKSRKEKKSVWTELTNISLPPGKKHIVGSDIKGVFREHVLSSQNGRCCYCRRWLVNNAWAKPVEHILSQRDYPQFSLDYWNLAVSCYDCNEVKKAKLWGSISKTANKYPHPGDFHDMFHPRFHVYDEHIKFIRVETNKSAIALYKGRTLQGKQICRDLLASVAGKEILIQNNKPLANSISEFNKTGIKSKLADNQQFITLMKTINSRAIALISGP